MRQASIAKETVVEPDQARLNELAGIRILVIMPSIPIQGMERKNLQIMGGLHRLGANVLFVTQRIYGDRSRAEIDRIGCRWTTASFNKLPHLSRNPREMAGVLYDWIKSARELKRICKDFKPTHIHITDLMYFLYAWPMVMSSSARAIFSLPVPPDTELIRWKQRLSNLVWRFGIARACDTIICNSQYTLSQLKKIGVKTRKVKVIYNCVPERTAVEKSDAPRVDSGKFNIVFMGRICADKGVKELIDAAFQVVSEREDVDFYLAGQHNWRNPFAEALIEEVRTRNLESRIRFLGEIYDVMGLLAQCDLHICPSVWEEPFGLVVLEAKSRSLPSVVFPSGGLKETVEHLVDGYICDSKSSQQLYKGMRYFLDNPLVLKTAGEAAKRSLARFSKERCLGDWIRVLNA